MEWQLSEPESFQRPSLAPPTAPPFNGQEAPAPPELSSANTTDKGWKLLPWVTPSLWRSFLTLSVSASGLDGEGAMQRSGPVNGLLSSLGRHFLI